MKIEKEKFRNLGMVLGIAGNVIILATAPFAGIETDNVYLVKGIGTGILLIGILSLSVFWIRKRKDVNLQKK